ncbi:ATP-binding protein, partial [Prevotella copri]|nr:ATP-binding protein [Segatella copri]
MEQRLIGREAELKLLNEYINSDRSEFIAVYGRRRVGKTFLIRKAVEDHFAFFMTGMNGVAKGEQLVNFSISLQKYTHSTTLQTFKSWLLAFYALSQYIEILPEGKKVIFIDELPWMDTAKSGFIPALENFWNSWAVLRNDIKLIVCGSATSWMINNLIRNRG